MWRTPNWFHVFPRQIFVFSLWGTYVCATTTAMMVRTKDRGHKLHIGPTQTILTNLSPDFSKPKYHTHGGQRSQSSGNIHCANLIEVWFDLIDFPLIRWCPRLDGISTLTCETYGEKILKMSTFKIIPPKFYPEDLRISGILKTKPQILRFLGATT